jgi:hypothetical protein
VDFYLQINWIVYPAHLLKIMLVANLNVFIAILAGAGYMFAWCLGIPVSMLIIPYDGSLVAFEALLLFVALILIFIWARRGLVLPLREPKYVKLHQIGHGVLAIANLVLVGGIGLFLRAASLSREDEYWFGLVMTSYIGPIGGVLAAAGLALVLLIPLRRNRRD